jgi:hypothetical protein
MRRREFITVLGGAAVAGWPLAAHAQQPERMRRVGVLAASAEDDPETQARLAAFRQRLEKRGWFEGRNVHIETRFAAGEKFEPLARELVATQPDVILAHTTPVAAALQRESRTIPIVFVNVSDPIDAPIRAVCRDKSKAKLLAHDTGEEAADRMGLPLRCPCHRLDGRAVWRSQHCNDVSLFAFATCSRLRRGPALLISRRLCIGLELSRLVCGRPPYAVTDLGLAVVCA